MSRLIWLILNFLAICLAKHLVLVRNCDHNHFMSTGPYNLTRKELPPVELGKTFHCFTLKQGYKKLDSGQEMWWLDGRRNGKRFHIPPTNCTQKEMTTLSFAKQVWRHGTPDDVNIHFHHGYWENDKTILASSMACMRIPVFTSFTKFVNSRSRDEYYTCDVETCDF